MPHSLSLYNFSKVLFYSNFIPSSSSFNYTPSFDCLCSLFFFPLAFDIVPVRCPVRSAAPSLCNSSRFNVLISSLLIILLFHYFFPLFKFVPDQHFSIRGLAPSFSNSYPRPIVPSLFLPSCPGGPPCMRVFSSRLNLLPYWLSFTRDSRRASSIYRFILKATSNRAVWLDNCRQLTVFAQNHYHHHYAALAVGEYEH